MAWITATDTSGKEHKVTEEAFNAYLQRNGWTAGAAAKAAPQKPVAVKPAPAPKAQAPKPAAKPMVSIRNNRK